MSVRQMSFVAPLTVEDVLAELADEGSILLGGGTSTALLLKNGFLDAERLVYLGRVKELAGVARASDGSLVIGATTTLRELYMNSSVMTFARIVSEAAGHVGNPRVRAVATVGGALVHADPRQDLPPALIALGASAKIVGPRGPRELPVAQLAVSFMETVVAEDELLVEVRVPVDPRRRTAYTRFTSGSADDYPTVAAAGAITLDNDGTVSEVKLVLAGVGPTALMVHEVADVMEGKRPTDQHLAAASLAAREAADPTDDARGSTDYKRALVAALTRKTLRACLSRPV